MLSSPAILQLGLCVFEQFWHIHITDRSLTCLTLIALSLFLILLRTIYPRLYRPPIYSRLITEVKQHWAELVLEWVIAWKYQVL